jgi:glycosyltransferase involved in cell wall biosynthesis
MIAISVVIPTYNRGELLPLAIDSVLAQTHPATEVIVVDDGSAQDMREVLARYGSSIQVIRQANAGLSGARNTGIKAATSEWVAFLDDDDEYAPGRLAIAAESIRSFPRADAHLTNTAIVLESGAEADLFQLRRKTATPLMEVARPLAWILQGCFFAQSLVARRSALHEIGLFRPTFYEDMDLFVRLAARPPWIVDSRPMLRLIRRSNTTAMSDDWRSKPIVRCEALVRIHRAALAYPDLTAAEAHIVRDCLGTHLFDLGAAHANKGDSRAARGFFAEAARTFPAARSRLKAHAAAIGGRPVIGLLQRIARQRKGLVR